MRELRRVLMKSGGRAGFLRTLGDTHKGVLVEDVRLDEAGRDIEILFRDLGRVECLFGFSAEAVERGQLRSDGTPHNYYTLQDAARSHADMLWVNFEEEVYAARYGLPNECSPDGVNWL